ncbi:MAG TPA: hypothetical protein PKD83_10305 [Ignavibacteria bacterium]|nr:hypothetical protein [Ignavibacteria bacterium]
MSFSYKGNDPIDRIGVQGPLNFDGINYNLVWSDKPRDTYYIQEYLPEGENVESFKQMLTIHLFDVDITAEDGVNRKINELKKRAETDPICFYDVYKSPDGSEVMIDFTLGENKNGEQTIAEFNIYRYKLTATGSGKNALLVYAYTERAYGESISGFLKDLKSVRPELTNKMSQTELPAIRLNPE